MVSQGKKRGREWWWPVVFYPPSLLQCPSLMPGHLSKVARKERKGRKGGSLEMARGGNGRERSKRRAVKRGKWDEKETFPFATAQSRMCIYSGHVLSSVQFCISSLLPLFWQGGRGDCDMGSRGKEGQTKKSLQIREK